MGRVGQPAPTEPRLAGPGSFTADLDGPLMAGAVDDLTTAALRLRVLGRSTPPVCTRRNNLQQPAPACAVHQGEHVHVQMAVAVIGAIITGTKQTKHASKQGAETAKKGGNCAISCADCF